MAHYESYPYTWSVLYHHHGGVHELMHQNERGRDWHEDVDVTRVREIRLTPVTAPEHAHFRVLVPQGARPVFIRKGDDRARSICTIGWQLVTLMADGAMFVYGVYLIVFPDGSAQLRNTPYDGETEHTPPI